MKSGKKIYILYHSGSYGSWVRWLMEYSNDVGHRHKQIPDDPVISDGSSHSMITLPNAHPSGLNETLDTLKEVVGESCGYKIYRVIPVTDESTTIDMVLSALSYNKDTEDRIIYIDVDGQYNKEITFLNIELKVGMVNFSSALSDKIKMWDQNKSKFEELERWQQRELISLYYEKMIYSMTESPKEKYDAMVINMSDIFKEDVVSFAAKIVEYCNLPARKNIDAILRKAHDKMLKKQVAFDLHRAVYDTVNACLKNENISIPPLSLFAEAMVQNLLLKQGKEIRCYRLNEFPSTTGQLMELII